MLVLTAATVETTTPVPAERERLLALGAALVTVDGLGLGVRRHPLGVAPAVSGSAGVRTALDREPRAGPDPDLAPGAAAVAPRSLDDRARRRVLVRALQHRAQRGRAPRRRRDRGDARQHRADPDRGPRRVCVARGLSAEAVRRIGHCPRGSGGDCERDLGERARGELGRAAVRVRCDLLCGRRRRPEARPGTRVGAAGDVARVHVRRSSCACPSPSRSAISSRTRLRRRSSGWSTSRSPRWRSAS